MDDLIAAHIILFVCFSYITLVISYGAGDKRSKVIGYRTNSSLRSDKNWKIANDLSKKLSVYHYLFTILCQVIFFFLIYSYSALLTIIVYIVGFLIQRVIIENELGR